MNKPKSGKLLPRVDDPSDLRGLDREDLTRLADEIREEILSAICTTGGHLASSLGVVELAIAIHYSFNTPYDKVIWDVGHQTYPHKILTGRRERFSSIRCHQGLSGFPKRNESPYDAFGTGHASTSISAAMGMAEAIRLSGKFNNVIAVIGDGGLTGGIALEALNQTRADDYNLKVILNDNEMSIAPSVGQLSTWLSRSVVSKPALKAVRVARRVAEPLPEWLFEELSYLGKRWRQSFLTFWTPGTLFEALGYHYIGPVDGHRLDQLLPALDHAKEIDAPVLVHVMTTKGKGCAFAEEHPSTFHGIGPFDPETGETPAKEGPPSYTGVFAKTMLELFESNEKLVAITAAMPQGTGLDKVGKKYPDRVFDMGITEPHCVTFAAGMACEGYRPVVAIYSTFLQRAYDQIIHDVALQKLPVIFCLDRAGLVGEDGPTHHGAFDISYLRAVPNVQILSPSDENELRAMLHAAASRDGGPIAIRYPRGRALGAPMPEEPPPIPWGKGELKREGKDLVIIAAGNMVAPSLEAAALLDSEGISAAVINARFVKPLDRELILEWAERTGRVVTVEENALAGGFGSAVIETVLDAGQSAAFRRIGLEDGFVEQGPPAALRRELGLDGEGIASSCRDFIQGKRARRKVLTPV